MKIQSPKTVLGYLIAVFVVGVAIGAMTGYTAARKSPARLPSEQEAAAAWLRQYRSKLSLTDEQVRALQPLLPKAVEELGGIWYRAIMTMGAVREGVDRKIEPLLDDQQRQKLISWIRESREERRRVARAHFPETGEDGDLWTAAAKGNLDAISRHLENGADPNQPDLGFGLTPLTLAAIHGQTEAVEWLLQKGADVNARHPDGNTALHAAAFFGRLESVQRLIAAGADTRARNKEGKTPLEGMSADWETLQFIGAILQVELDKAGLLASRQAVAELLASANGGRGNVPIDVPTAPRRNENPPGSDQ